MVMDLQSLFKDVAAQLLHKSALTGLGLSWTLQLLTLNGTSSGQFLLLTVSNVTLIHEFYLQI